MLEQGLGRCPAPVIIGIPEAMDRGREHIVKVMQGACALQPLPVEHPRRLLPFGEGLGHQGTHEHGGIDPAIEPLAQIDASGHQVQRRTDHCRALDEFCGRLLLQPGPARQGIAAQRHSHGQQLSPRALTQPAQNPVQLVRIAGVVGA